MPVTPISPTQLMSSYGLGVKAPEEKVYDDLPFISELLPAAMRQENIFSGILADAASPSNLNAQETADLRSGKFNSFELTQQLGITDAEERSALVATTSMRQFQWKQNQIKQENIDRQMLSEAGTGETLLAYVFAAGLDPTLLPFMMLPIGYGSTAARMAKASAAGVAVSTAAEIGLHAQQTKRTLGESWMNVGGAALFGLALGPLGTRFTPAERAAVISKLDELSAMPDGAIIPGNTDFVGPLPPGDRSGGAAQVGAEFNSPEFREFAKADDIEAQFASGKITSQQAAQKLRDKQLDWFGLKYGNNPVMKFLSHASPQLRVMYSKSVGARSVLENLVEDSYLRTKNQYGLTSGPAAETEIRRVLTKGRADIIEAIDRGWNEYKKSGATDIKDKNEFATQVFWTAIDDGKHVNPSVRAAYSEYNALQTEIEKGLVENQEIPTIHGAINKQEAKASEKWNIQREKDRQALLKEQRKELSALGDDVGTKAALAREHKKDLAALEVEQKFITKEMRDEFALQRKNTPDGAQRPLDDPGFAPRVYDFDKIVHNRLGFKNAILNYLRSQVDNEKRWAEMAGDIESKLDETIDKIVGSPHGYATVDITPSLGHLIDRKIRVPTTVLRDFLITDIRDVHDSYLRGTMPGVMLKRRFGDADLTGKIREIEEEYARLMEATPANSKAAKKLDADRNRTIRDIKAMTGLILGTYRRPDDPTSAFTRWAHRARAHSYVTSLGSMTVSALPDLGQIIARVGMKPFAKGLAGIAFATKDLKLSMAEARRYGIGLDATINSRAHAMMLMEDAYTTSRKVDRVIDWGVRSFSKATGMTHWNAGLKQFAAGMYMDDILRQMAKGQNVEKIAAAGISKSMQRRILGQFDKYGTKDKFFVANADAWDDIDASLTFKNALLKEADTAIVTPGVGDLPLWSRGPVGKLVFQFKSFLATAQNRILYAGLQRHDANFLMGMMTMMSLGAASYSIYQISRGQEIDGSRIVDEALNRAGVIGYMGEINELLFKATRGGAHIIPRWSETDDPLTRFSHRSVLADMMGPSYGTGEDILKIFGGAASGDIKESDIRAFRRLLPYQNLFYLRHLLTQVEDAAKEKFVE